MLLKWGADCMQHLKARPQLKLHSSCSAPVLAWRALCTGGSETWAAEPLSLRGKQSAACANTAVRRSDQTTLNELLSPCPLP
jgi:hypothetical protein